MKRLVPSTPGEVTVVLVRRQGRIEAPRTFAKFVSVREIVNAMLAEWDTEANPVMSVELKYTFPVERS
jgi:hypothetical protein